MSSYFISTSSKRTATLNAGRYVEITSADGTVRTRYMHLSAISVIEGQYVFEADKISNMGGSGKGSEHTTIGVMTPSISDKGRSWSVSQETVNNIVESNGFNQNPTLWQKIKSWFE